MGEEVRGPLPRHSRAECGETVGVPWGPAQASLCAVVTVRSGWEWMGLSQRSGQRGGWLVGFLSEGEEATRRLPRGSDRVRPQSGRALCLGVAGAGRTWGLAVVEVRGLVLRG